MRRSTSTEVGSVKGVIRESRKSDESDCQQQEFQILLIDILLLLGPILTQVNLCTMLGSNFTSRRKWCLLCNNAYWHVPVERIFSHSTRTEEETLSQELLLTSLIVTQHSIKGGEQQFLFQFPAVIARTPVHLSCCYLLEFWIKLDTTQ